MKENGDWEPIDECRAAWRERVSLPHAEFEILLRRHMGQGLPVSARAHDIESAVARPSAAAVRAAVTTLLAAPPLRRNALIAAAFADDGNMGSDIHNAITDVGSPAADPARAAWAVQAVVAGLYDNMPKNFWCSHPLLEDAFRLALEDIAEPATHIFVSELCAIHRLQSARRLVSALPVALRKTGEPESNLYHLCAYMHAFTSATVKAVVANATAEYEAQLKQSGVSPLRRLLDRGPA